jgi:hypothetical protein
MPTPRRRWFAFRLQTLFVVVAILSIPLAWVGYSLSWIKQRRDAITPKKVSEIDMRDALWPAANPDGPTDAPSGLWVFGEKGIYAIALHWEASDSDLERVMRLFPEAKVVRSPLPRKFPGQP